MRSLAILPIILLAANVANAETLASDGVKAQTKQSSMYDLGFRIGGYGFRREGDNGSEAWTECQMGGIGVFGSRKITGPLFVEAAIDAYTSRNEGLPTDLPITRMSGLASVAAGARTNFTSWLRGFVQLGGGLELTRVSVPYGDQETQTIRDTKLMPTGFIGVGFDLKIARKTYLGMNIRTLLMGNFNYSREQLEMTENWGFTQPSEDEVFDASLDFAAQGQFFLRRDM